MEELLVVKALGYKPDGRGFETRWGEILNLPNLSGRTRPWGFTQPLTEMSTGNIKKNIFLGSKVRPVQQFHTLEEDEKKALKIKFAIRVNCLYLYSRWKPSSDCLAEWQREIQNFACKLSELRGNKTEGLSTHCF
jgi:hypothetical protein